MKRWMLLLALAFALGTVSAMADANTYSKPGSIAIQAGVGLAWGHFGGVNLQGGLDVGMAQFKLAPEAPFDVGLAVRAGYSSWDSLILGGYGTLHYSWKSLGSSLGWLNHLETYAGLGIDALPGLAMDFYLGTDYHFTRAFALFLEGGVHGSVLGASFRF